MSLILLMLGCGRGAQPSDSTATSPPTDVIQLDPTGLPDCANSISDTSFCNGWAWQAARGGVAGGSSVPDWLWRAQDSAAVYLSTTFEGKAQFLCADDAATAESLLQAVFPQDERYLSGVDERDPRWLDVLFDDTGTAHKVFRVPRCAVFT